VIDVATALCDFPEVISDPVKREKPKVVHFMWMADRETAEFQTDG
jgi:hypothetical protein